jgi:hypothetical protein
VHDDCASSSANDAPQRRRDDPLQRPAAWPRISSGRLSSINTNRISTMIAPA